MMRSSLLVFGFCAIAAGAADAAGSGLPPGYDGIWTLQTIDGAAYRAPITLSLTGPGQFAGQGPCNRYSGVAEGQLPAFQPTSVGATRMSCPKLAMEQEYLNLLYQVNEAVAGGGTLTLRTVNGRKLVFTANGP